MNKSFRGGHALLRLIENAPVDLLARFLTQPDAAVLETAPSERSGWLEALSDASEALSRRLDDEAARILVLSEDGARDLDKIVATERWAAKRPTYNAQLDPLGRSLWAFLDARQLFEDAESFHHALQYRGFGKPYAAFEVVGPSGQDFDWTPELEQRLMAQIRTALKLEEDCAASHLIVREQRSGPPIHIIIVRHPGPLLSVAEHRQDGAKDRHYYKPPNEATLFYDPGQGIVEICAESPSVRQDIAVCFAEAGLGMNLSNKSLTFVEYDLRQLQKSLTLPWVDVEGFSILRAAITELDFRPGNPLHRVSVKVTIDDDMRSLVERYLGAANPLSRGALSRAMISVHFSRIGSRQQKTLNVAVSYPNRCNLRSQEDPEKRQVGRALLQGWRILRTSHAMSPQEERAIFPALLDLYAQNVGMMTERELASHGFDVQQLIDARVAEPRGRLSRLGVEEEEDFDVFDSIEGIGGTAEFTDSRGGQAWAPGALVRNIGINEAYLAELILRELQVLLHRTATAPIGKNLLSLGSMELLGDTPVYLARRLDDADAVCDVDLRLRGFGMPGVGLILSAGETPALCIGRNVVISLRDVLEAKPAAPALSEDAVRDLYRQRRGLALGGQNVELLDNPFGGKTLHLPDRLELVLNGDKQLLVVERLVQAFRAGTPVVQTCDLMAGTGSDSPSHAFGKRWSHVNDAYICKVGNRSGWRLNV